MEDLGPCSVSSACIWCVERPCRGSSERSPRVHKQLCGVTSLSGSPQFLCYFCFLQLLVFSLLTRKLRLDLRSSAMHRCVWGQAAGGQRWNESKFSSSWFHPLGTIAVPVEVSPLCSFGSWVPMGNSHRLFSGAGFLAWKAPFPVLPLQGSFAVTIFGKTL